MAWANPIFKQLAASELGLGHTAGVVFGRMREYFGVPPGGNKEAWVRFFVDGTEFTRFTTNLNYYTSATHNHIHVTGNILSVLVDCGARPGDYLAVWKNVAAESDYIFELVLKNGGRTAELFGRTPKAVTGEFQASPPGITLEAVAAAAAAAEITEESSKAAFVRESRQRYASNTELKKAVEQRAMSIAIEFYERLGYEVEVTAATKPYDLSAVRDNAEVRVEVKGTVSMGDSVFLTRNEVINAQGAEAYSVDLFVVSQIDITATSSGVVAKGGRIRRLESWCPNEEHLLPIVFSYSLLHEASEPAGGESP